jgi:hypothetical protein
MEPVGASSSDGTAALGWHATSVVASTISRANRERSVRRICGWHLSITLLGTLSTDPMLLAWLPLMATVNVFTGLPD